LTACGYQLRVQFDDGSTTEVFCRVMHRDGCRGMVGGLIPVRYDPEGRSKIEVDIPVLNARREATTARTKADAIARGEAALRRHSEPPTSEPGDAFVAPPEGESDSAPPRRHPPSPLIPSSAYSD
jgi:hypothetical protein